MFSQAGQNPEWNGFLQQQVGDVINEAFWDDDEDDEGEARSARLFAGQNFESNSYIDVQKHMTCVNVLQEDVNIIIIQCQSDRLMSLWSCHSMENRRNQL